MHARALIVDDEIHIRELIELTLKPLGVHCLMAETLGQAHALLKNHRFDFAITDMRLPDGNGLALLDHIQTAHPRLPVAVITAHGNVESAVASLKRGAFDFIAKPFEIATLRNVATTALNLVTVDAADADPHAEDQPMLLGQSAAMETVRAHIHKLARSQAPILISGESGTGKELAAHLIHLHGPRRDRPFVPVNCGAIPDHLMESEFFGYQKGSFTGASSDQAGLFQAAQGGTLFLDEVADLPQPMQVKLLRAIQERAVRPIGAAAEIAVDVRLLSATHKELAQLVEHNQFRQDLYYRLNVIEVRMPSLRERAEDISELVALMLRRLNDRPGVDAPPLSAEAMAALRAYHFPGNVRELENILERAATLCDDALITPPDLHLRVRQARVDPPTAAATILPDPIEIGLDPYLEDREREAILDVLETTDGKKTAAAKKLGISYRTLRYRLKKLGLD